MPNYNLKIRTLAPVHIGDGLAYDGMTSFEHNKKFIPLDSHSLINVFNKQNISLKDFKKWIEDKKQERENRKPNISEFIRYNYPKKADSVINSLVESGKTQIENLSQTRMYADILTCMKVVDDKPYIPGSEIKGAIVTTIMFDLLKNDNRFLNKLKNILEENHDFLTDVYESMKKVKNLTERKKHLGFQNYRELGISRDKQRDFRRIITMREREIHYIQKDLINKMKMSEHQAKEICDKIQDWRNGDKRTYRDKIRSEQRKYDTQKINIIIKQLNKLEEEYWNTYLALSPSKADRVHKLMRFLQISDSNAPVPSKITNCLIIHKNPRITMDLFFEIIDTDCKFESRLTVDKNDLAISEIKFPQEHSKILDKDYILECIYNFADRSIEEEAAFIERLDNFNYRFSIEDIKSQLDDLKFRNRPNSPLLRIGKGQGFLSLTIAMMIKDYDAEIYQKLLGVVQSNKNNPEDYPVTRRLFTDGSNKYKFPGWIKLSLEEA